MKIVLDYLTRPYIYYSGPHIVIIFAEKLNVSDTSYFTYCTAIWINPLLFWYEGHFKSNAHRPLTEKFYWQAKQFFHILLIYSSCTSITRFCRSGSFLTPSQKPSLWSYRVVKSQKDLTTPNLENRVLLLIL